MEPLLADLIYVCRVANGTRHPDSSFRRARAASALKSRVERLLTLEGLCDSERRARVEVISADLCEQPRWLASEAELRRFVRRHAREPRYRTLLDPVAERVCALRDADLSLAEIAEELGVTQTMISKVLVRACRCCEIWSRLEARGLLDDLDALVGEEDAELIRLRCDEGLAFADMADRLGLTINDLKRRCRRVWSKLPAAASWSEDEE